MSHLPRHLASTIQLASASCYFHLTEFGSLELCCLSDLTQNKLNGQLIDIKFLGRGCRDREILLASYSAVCDILFLVISVDPFHLPVADAHWLSSLKLPIGLILSDTHHGRQPLTRVVDFCLTSNVQSILLRFNQRHARIFQCLGIWADATVFSPDLFLLATDKLTEEKSQQSSRIGSFRDNTFSSLRLRHGIFMGSATRMHPYRASQLDLLKSCEYSFDVRSTPNPVAMIDLMSTYAWGLNLPLNGDFNRRFIEILLADIPVLSERIPRSQLVFPFSLLARHMSFFDCFPRLNTIKLCDPFGVCNDTLQPNQSKRSPLQTLLFLLKSGYDQSVLGSFANSLISKRIGFHDFDEVRVSKALRLYDQCLQLNSNPGGVEVRSAVSLLVQADRECTLFGLDVFDVFFRLSSI